MRGYFQLPAYHLGNGIDFSPVERALDGLQQQQHRNALMARDDKRLAMEDERWRTTDARAEQQFALQRRRAELEEQDRPLDRQMREAQLAHTLAQTQQLGRKDALESAIADMISRSMGVSEAPPPHSTPGSASPNGGPNPGGGAFIPQSYGGQPEADSRNALMEVHRTTQAPPPATRNALMNPEPQYRPGVILAADDMQYGSEGPPRGSVASPAAPPASELIDTPLGRMPRERARQLGMGLALAGKGDAGRMLADSASPGANLQKPTLNQLEERTLNSAMQLGRLADIKKRFDPKFLEIPQRMKLLGQSWSAKMGGKLSPQQRSELNRYAAFRSSTVNNANQILKELSGAAVTPQEYERIQNDIPIAGTGVFDGDDPVSFMAKFDRSEQSLRSAVARYNFMRSQGLNFTKDNIDMFMGLDDVPAAYEKRAGEIESLIRQRNPGIEPQALEEQTAVQLKREWGI